MKHEAGFTLIEIMIVLSLMAILSSVAVPKFGGYLNYLKLEAVTNQLVSDLQWARQKAITKGEKYGVVFDSSNNLYFVVRNYETPEKIRRVDLNDRGVFFGEITFVEYDHLEGNNKAVFFKILGNLDGANGSIRLKLADYGTKKITYSSNAGELNVE